MADLLRADNVGSFLRPAYLTDALDRRADDAELRQLEDRAVREVVALQEELGMPVVTDGEFRRRVWYGTMTRITEGFDPERFERVYTDEQGRQDRHGGPVVVTPLERTRSQVDFELAFLREQTDRPVKITIPSPSHFLSYWTPGVSDRAYPDRQAFLDALIGLMHEDAVALANAGAAYLQIDAPKYTYFHDERLYPDADRRAEQLAEYVRQDARVLAGVEGVVTGLHICRGNYRGMYGSSTPYEEFAEVLFREADSYDRLLLEYDSVPAGGFEALRFVPDDTVAVLGLVSTKTPELEDPDALRRQIDEASRHLPLDLLAVSPQCGFASAYQGNQVTVDDERRKLELVLRTAEDVWGGVGSPMP
ncbi:MAG TPA: cobalamin-independent methionine synthase II family protein [Euzebyales bacterium]|nr:cobalamin-independent methionine synthase II family protein [Euzebyales bacterium]